MLAEMGLSGTFAREAARLSAIGGGAQQIRDLCRTFEGIFYAVGLLIALVIAASSKSIAVQWVNLEHLSVNTASTAILLIGISVGLQFPFLIYQGGMQGLQRQTSLNILLVSLGFLRGAGAILVLVYIDCSIQAFFVWQVAINVILLFVAHIMIWRSLPDISTPPRFNLRLIRPLWRFAAGTAGITLSGIILTQADKFILIKLLPLREFGYYALASVIASVPGMIAMSFNNAIYPRFTQLVATGSFPELIDLYHRSCQALAALLIPVGLVLMFFSKEVMLIWTGSPETAQNTFLLVSVLVAGSTLMGLMLIPYTLQLAFAWTRLGLYLNIVALVTLIPSLVWVVSLYGALGASFVWVALYTGQIIGMIHLMHRRILKGEKRKWYINDVGQPLLASMIVVGIGRLFINEATAKPLLLASLVAILLLTLFASVMSVTFLRNAIFAKIVR
jgi:O-antigen/teichoic acid export membrane protein